MASETEPADIDIDTEIWNERSETRTKVLRRLKAVIKDRLNHDTVPVTFWAFCQVADISKLEELIERAESTRGTEYLKEPLLYKIILSDDIVDKCKLLEEIYLCSCLTLFFDRVAKDSRS